MILWKRKILVLLGGCAAAAVLGLLANLANLSVTEVYALGGSLASAVVFLAVPWAFGFSYRVEAETTASTDMIVLINGKRLFIETKAPISLSQAAAQWELIDASLKAAETAAAPPTVSAEAAAVTVERFSSSQEPHSVWLAAS
jgi:hypothetical protein